MSMDKNENKLNLRKVEAIPCPNSALKYHLILDDNTAFDLNFDVFNYDGKEYLYFKLEEYTEVPSFYYDVSIEKEELNKLNSIFKEYDMAFIKDLLSTLIDKKKVELNYGNEEKTQIIMEFELSYLMEITKLESIEPFSICLWKKEPL